MMVHGGKDHELVAWGAHISFLFLVSSVLPSQDLLKISLSFIAVCLDKDKDKTLQRTGCLGSVHAKVTKIAASRAPLGLTGEMLWKRCHCNKQVLSASHTLSKTSQPGYI